MNTTTATDQLRCETGSNGAGRCPNVATHVVTQTYVGYSAAACGECAGFWTRTKKIRGQLVRVHPNMTAELL